MIYVCPSCGKAFTKEVAEKYEKKCKYCDVRLKEGDA